MKKLYLTLLVALTCVASSAQANSPHFFKKSISPFWITMDAQQRAGQSCVGSDWCGNIRPDPKK